MKLLVSIILIYSNICLSQKKVGIFTGTFDPIHMGHIENMLTAIDQMDLDEVIVSPLVKTPHKSPILSFTKRWELLDIAIAKHPKIKLYSQELLIELSENGIPHQNMLNFIKKDLLIDDMTYHIVGADTFERLFYRPNIIDETLSFNNHKILILNRSGYSVDIIPNTLKSRVISLSHPGGDRGFSSSSFRKDPFSAKSSIPKRVWSNIISNGYYFKNKSFSNCDKAFLGVFH
jgi:nicotinate-nucleotide adenylyltransferase